MLRVKNELGHLGSSYWRGANPGAGLVWGNAACEAVGSAGDRGPQCPAPGRSPSAAPLRGSLATGWGCAEGEGSPAVLPWWLGEHL